MRVSLVPGREGFPSLKISSGHELKFNIINLYDWQFLNVPHIKTNDFTNVVIDSWSVVSRHLF